MKLLSQPYTQLIIRSNVSNYPLHITILIFMWYGQVTCPQHHEATVRLSVSERVPIRQAQALFQRTCIPVQSKVSRVRWGRKPKNEASTLTSFAVRFSHEYKSTLYHPWKQVCHSQVKVILRFQLRCGSAYTQRKDDLLWFLSLIRMPFGCRYRWTKHKVPVRQADLDTSL